MELNEKDYVVGIWRATLPADAGRPGDFLMTLWRTPTDWCFEYRFRYYKDDKVFDSEDEKSFYAGKRPLEGVSAEEAKRPLEALMRERFPGYEYIPVEGGVEAMRDVMIRTEGFCVRMQEERPGTSAPGEK